MSRKGINTVRHPDSLFEVWHSHFVIVKMIDINSGAAEAGQPHVLPNSGRRRICESHKSQGGDRRIVMHRYLNATEIIGQYSKTADFHQNDSTIRAQIIRARSSDKVREYMRCITDHEEMSTL